MKKDRFEKYLEERDAYFHRVSRLGRRDFIKAAGLGHAGAQAKLAQDRRNLDARRCLSRGGTLSPVRNAIRRSANRQPNVHWKVMLD